MVISLFNKINEIIRITKFLQTIVFTKMRNNKSKIEAIRNLTLFNIKTSRNIKIKS